MSMYRLRGRSVCLVLSALSLSGCLIGAQRDAYDRLGGDVLSEPGFDLGPPPERGSGWSTEDEEALAAGPLTLARALTLARERNSELRAALHSWKRVVEQIPQEASWPDPQLRYTYMAAPLHTRAGPQRQNLALSQRIPFPGKLSASTDAAVADAEAEAASYLARVLDLEERVARAWAEIFRQERMLEVVAAQLKIVEQFEGSVRDAFGAGRAGVTGSHAARARLRRTLLSAQKVQHERGLAVGRAKLNELLGRPPTATLPATPVQPTLPPLPAGTLAELVQEGLVHRPELRAAVHRTERGRARSRRAWYEFFPDFVAGVQWFDIGGSSVTYRNAEDDALGVTFGIDLPIFVEGRSARLRQAEAETRAAEASVQMVRDRIGREVAVALSTARAADESLEIFNTALSQATTALRSAQDDFSATRGDFTTVLEAERDLEEARHGIHMSQADGIAARAALWRALGRPQTTAQQQ